MLCFIGYGMAGLALVAGFAAAVHDLGWKNACAFFGILFGSITYIVTMIYLIAQCI